MRFICNISNSNKPAKIDRVINFRKQDLPSLQFPLAQLLLASQYQKQIAESVYSLENNKLYTE